MEFKFGNHTINIKPELVIGIIFVIAGFVLLFMNFTGAVEGLGALFLLFVGLYLMGVLK